WGAVFDKNGNLFVANQSNNTVREFGPTGTDLGTFASTGLSQPTDLAFDASGNLYVTNLNQDSIRKFGPTGTDLGYFATNGLDRPGGRVFAPRAGIPPPPPPPPPPPAANLLVNGDFEAGNTGFTSQYIFSSDQIGDAGVYTITTNPEL